MRVLWLGMCLAIGATCARASAAPYWVAWEGNDYPENEGWQRVIEGEGQVTRTLDDGVLSIDSLSSAQVADFYRIDRDLNPGAGERFVIEWRLRVNEVIGNPLALYDPGLGVFSDDDWALAFWIGVDGLFSFHERLTIPFQPGVFHSFEIQSFDMRSYELRIDGIVAHDGTWWEPAFDQSSVRWGDFTRGASASQHDWDYFRFGVVPEPSTKACALLMLLFGREALARRCA